MTRGAPTVWLGMSVLVHAAVLAVVCALPRRDPPVVPTPPSMEFSLTAPPAPPTPPAVRHPSQPAAVPPVSVTAAVPTVRARVAVRQTVRTVPAPTVPAPTAVPAPTVPAPTAVPPPVAVPVSPRVPPQPAVLHATDLLRDARSDVSLGLAAVPMAAPTAPRVGFVGGESGTVEARARAASQGFVQDVLTASTRREAPGVSGYLWNVRRHVAESWQPGVVRVPNLADTLMAGFIAPERALRIFGDRMARRQREALEPPPPREGGAAEAIAAMGGVMGAGPGGRRTMPADAGDESWRRNVRTTTAEVQVDQDDHGRVLAVRLLHASGIDGFDRAAMEAVQHGIDAQDPVALPGGRRSRWSFTVVATRRLFTPSVGGGFDESHGWFRLEVPGQVTMRSRVQMESSAPLSPVPATGPGRVTPPPAG